MKKKFRFSITGLMQTDNAQWEREVGSIFIRGPDGYTLTEIESLSVELLDNTSEQTIIEKEGK